MGSKTNTRRLKRVYRCDECARTFRSLQASNFHRKTHYKNASKQMRNKKQTGSVEARKIDDNVTPKKIEQVFVKPEAKIAPVSSSGNYGKKLLENVSRKIEFSCPKCDKSFNVYFSAFRHVQKYHCVDAKGNPVDPNSPHLIKPIRKEQCPQCLKNIKASEFHTCEEAPNQDNLGRPADTYMCIGCAQNFTTVKTFDLHIARVHNNDVQSLFLPSKADFLEWKERVEKQVNCKYALMNRYSAKDVYRCTYSPLDDDSGNLHFCPSSFIHQKFPKGVQVHFYPDHFGHKSSTYIPTAQDKQFCIKYLLDKAEGHQNLEDMTLDNTDLYIQFKNLMEHIVLEAAKLDIKRLKKFMEKALIMSSALKEYDEDEEVTEEVPRYTFGNKPLQTVDNKSEKVISDEQIHNELQDTSIRMSNRIRRKSSSIADSDFIHEPIIKKPKINTLTENESSPKESDKVNYETNISDKPELDEHEPLAQLRIVDTFSLNASCLPKSSNLLLGNVNESKKENLHGNGNETFTPNLQSPFIPPSQQTNEIKPDSLNETNKKDTPKVRFSMSQSQSFNDSYKEFVDKNFKPADTPIKPTKPKKQVMKTKIGQYIPNSPRRKSVSSPTLTLQSTPRTYANTKKINKAIPKIETKAETKLVSESVTKPISKIKSKPIHKAVMESVVESIMKTNHKSDMKPTQKSETKHIRKGDKKLANKIDENMLSKSDKKSLHKIEKKSLHKIEKLPKHSTEEKPINKGEPKSILKSNRKSLDNVAKKSKRTKLLLNKSLEIKYEIKEQENDCNILVLKI